MTTKTLEEVLDAFNRHDLDAIMKFFDEDCIFYAPKGTDTQGKHYTGKVQVSEGLSARFKGIPDVHYGEDIHWISEDGRRGVSEWTLSGKTTDGEVLNVRGCDLWEFRGGKIFSKNSFWKIIEK